MPANPSERGPTSEQLRARAVAHARAVAGESETLRAWLRDKGARATHSYPLRAAPRPRTVPPDGR